LFYVCERWDYHFLTELYAQDAIPCDCVWYHFWNWDFVFLLVQEISDEGSFREQDVVDGGSGGSYLPLWVPSTNLLAISTPFLLPCLFFFFIFNFFNYLRFGIFI
jgi:hypothetical protein